MNKPKIHELAKELNVTSKRLMEKLNEIGIHPKSHMTALESDQVEKLYKHIGVVRRSKNEDNVSHAEPKSEQANTSVKRNAPRIIRKTKVIIHDDTPVEEPKPQKGRRSFVRSSENNDGLMAGFTRGSGDTLITSVKKHPKSKNKGKEEHKEQNEVNPIFSEVDRSYEKPKKPIDDIISIKKVVRKVDKTEEAINNAESKGSKEQEDMQKNSIVMDKQDTKTDIREDNAVKTSVKSEDIKSEEIKSEKITKKPNLKTLDSDKDNKTETKEITENKADTKTKEIPEKGNMPKSDDVKNKSRDEKNQEVSRREPGRTLAQDRNAGRNESDFRGRRQNDNRGTNTRDARANSNRSQGDFISGGRREGGYQQRQGDFRSRPNGQGQRQGDFRSRPNNGQGQRQGDFRSRPNNGQGQRQGDFRSGGRREGGYQQRPGDRQNTGRPPFDRNRQSGFRRDDRGNAGRNNNNLVIPKASTPPGVVEEKVLTRGERRSFQTVEKQKMEKKAEKKTTSRNVPNQRNNHFKRKIDTVIGHEAKVKDMMSDEFVINTFYNDHEEAINAKRAEKRLRKNKQKEKYIPPKAVLTDITVRETLTVRELSEALKKTSAEVIKRLFLMGVVATQNQEIDFDTAVLIGDEFGVKVHKEVVVTQEDILFDDSEDTSEDLVTRAPVVVVMGHVDHGKTSLLDAIRSAHIAEREAGGITQHIGAYTVNLDGRDITFLDTPGHEAFTAMRARGAQVTDIAILVVAADDGVMPQTKEAISHAKAAGVSIIVAINKIDRPNANQERVKQELAENGLVVEEWGGDVIAVPVSAKQNENIDQLLEMVLLTADILELKANPNKQAKGTVIEAQLDKNRGPVATLLVQRGTLKVGDAILSGSTFGHIRSMTNDKGKKIDEAGPSIPVEVFGLSEVPEAGDLFYAVTDEKVAKQLAEKRKEEQREKHIGRAKISLDDLFNQIQQGNVKDLNLIVKADVQGSVQAICQSMEKISNDEVKVKVIHSGVGAVIEADIKLAEVSNAIIIGFNVRPSANVTEMANAAGVDMRLYRVIYDAIEDIEKAMKGMLAPTYKEVVDGHAEIRQIFKVSSVGTIGGSYVTDGKILRSSEARVVRDGIVIFEGKLASLKRFKDDAKEVATGYECGLMMERFNDIKEGDVIESFHMEEVERS